MEREGYSTLDIRSYLRALNFLGHMLFVCELFENILKFQCKADFVIILVSVLKNVYKVFLEIFILSKG